MSIDAKNISKNRTLNKMRLNAVQAINKQKNKKSSLRK